MMDFVIPCHEKDIPVLTLAVNSLQKYFVNNKIYLISPTNLNIEGTVQYYDGDFNKLFLLQDIKDRWIKNFKGLQHRSHWIYQQLLKLNAHKIITPLNENYIIVDSDCIFTKCVNFKKDIFSYSIAKEYHVPYTKTYLKIMKEATTVPFSFICHHMIFNKKYISELHNHIENIHSKTFNNVILDSLDYQENSSFSEWDLYGNWMFKNYPNQVEQRQLNWVDIPFIPDSKTIEDLSTHYDLVCPHAWMRGIE